MQQYSETVLDHFIHPRNMGELENADGIGQAGTEDDGDVVRFYIRVKDGRIADIRFQTFGCGAAIASSSAATELMLGLTLEEALSVTDEQIVESLGGLPESKIACSVLAPKALAAAVEDYRSGHAGQH